MTGLEIAFIISMLVPVIIALLQFFVQEGGTIMKSLSGALGL